MVLMNIKLDPALHKFRHYAEYRNMPHRALSKPGLASKSVAAHQKVKFFDHTPVQE